MKRRWVLVVALVLLAGPVFANPTFTPGKNLAASRCIDDPGKLAINIVQDVSGDIDSGVGGNYWAYDEYNRRIQVWKIGTDISNDIFCAVVRYMGSFVTVAGRSPANQTNISAGIEGTFEGGYRATITGLLLTPPVWDTRGNAGKFNYTCDYTTGNCPGYVSWLAQYFQDGYTFQYEWWGWIYRAGANGKWINQMDGNSGDIHD